MSETQNLIVETATQLFNDHCKVETLRQAEQGIWSAKLWQVVEETGLPLASLPESAGGVGGSLSDALAVLRIAGQFGAPLPLAETYLAGWIVSAAGLALPGGALTVAFSPKGALRFSRRLLSGTAPQVAYARHAAQILVLAPTEEDGDKLSLAWVSPEQVELEQAQNLAGEPRDNLKFDKLELGEVTPTHLSLEWVKNRATLANTALMVGALEAILKRTVEYARQREQFGRTLNQFQAIQQQLALMAADVTSARIGLEAAGQVAETEEANLTPAVAAARIRTVEATGQVVTMAHQVHGAMGYTYEYPLHFLSRRLWAWREETGSDSAWARWLGGYVTELGADKLWAGLIA
jgi:acyl-CoA dehydrogenase